jgi:hypothetical protein
MKVDQRAAKLEWLPNQERAGAQVRDPKRNQCAFLNQMHKSADAQRKRDEERVANPVFRGKAKDTTRKSSIEFFKMWH